MPADEICLEAEEKMEEAVEFLRTQFRTVRTGRASIGLVDHIKVDYYGAPTPLNQLANIATPEPQLIVIRPFDPNALKDIEKALQQSDLGINPTNDGKLIRLAVPPLSEDRRKHIAAQIKEIAEQTKIAIRNARRDANKHLDKEEKDSVISEDGAFSGKDDIQKLTKQYEEKVDELVEKKTAEIMEI
ncbi:MAG: ribosome recycling factor [Planctomycetes bacterium]|nr:ribosome recycling factor [Planctomycetota bacterium]